MRIAAMAAAAAIAGPFHADPDSNAERQARAWERDGRTADAPHMRRRAAGPQAFGLTGAGPRKPVGKAI